MTTFRFRFRSFVAQASAGYADVLNIKYRALQKNLSQNWQGIDIGLTEL